MCRKFSKKNRERLQRVIGCKKKKSYIVARNRETYLSGTNVQAILKYSFAYLERHFKEER